MTIADRATAIHVVVPLRRDRDHEPRIRQRHWPALRPEHEAVANFLTDDRHPIRRRLLEIADARDGGREGPWTRKGEDAARHELGQTLHEVARGVEVTTAVHTHVQDEV